PKAALSYFHHLGLFVLQELVDLLRVLVRQLLHPLFGPMLVVGTDVPAVDEVLQVTHRVTPDLPDGDTMLLRETANHLDEVLPPLLGQLRDRKPDELAVVRRRQSEVRLLNRLLDGADRAGVERLDGEHPRFRDADGSQLLERRLRPVVVDLDAVEQRCRRAARPDGVELRPRMLDRLDHPRLGVLDQLVDRCHLFDAPSYVVSMTVPTFSPATTRSMFPS